MTTAVVLTHAISMQIVKPIHDIVHVTFHCIVPLLFQTMIVKLWPAAQLLV